MLKSKGKPRLAYLLASGAHHQEFHLRLHKGSLERHPMTLVDSERNNSSVAYLPTKGVRGRPRCSS